MDQIQSMEEWKQALGMYEHQGITFTYLTPHNTWDELERFNVRNDDVFIITYPKSGSHWMMEIIQLLYNDAQPDKVDRTNLDTALEITMARTPEESKTAIPGYRKAVDWSSPRIILTHCFEHLLPKQVWEKKSKCLNIDQLGYGVESVGKVSKNIIYLVRNPKDISISSYHFINQLLPPFLKKDDAYFHYFLTDQYFGGPWFKHVQGYLAHQNDDNVLLVKYEDLHKDLKGEITRVNDHLGRPLSADKLDKMAELSTFSGMQNSYADADKAAEEKGDSKPSQLLDSIPYLRKGKIGQWKTHFSKEMNEKFDRIYTEKMAGSGLTLEFE